jgi:hypothetical protein
VYSFERLFMRLLKTTLVATLRPVPLGRSWAFAVVAVLIFVVVITATLSTIG